MGLVLSQGNPADFQNDGTLKFGVAQGGDDRMLFKGGKAARARDKRWIFGGRETPASTDYFAFSIA